ncbi:TetR/AcrR family transcriptional regulator [Paenibacillus sp. FSL H8-0332]|uniref:TetR/AcrR family transcriptional regulator n=1 Tax=Paenibacillus sp. FSL H8-0332 TaxID=2954742 RepID=UPI0030D33E3C
MAAKEDKKQKIMESALTLFAEYDYYRTTTAMVAKAAGVTQPYIFHFFDNKEDLYIAVLKRAYDRIHNTFMEVEAPADQLVGAMGASFFNLMQTHRSEVLMVMQAYTISEAGIKQHSAKLYTTIFNEVTAKFQKARVPDAEGNAIRFMSIGLLVTLSEVLDLSEIKQSIQMTKE